MAVAQQLANKDYIVPLLLGARRDGAGILSLWSESEQAWKVSGARPVSSLQWGRLPWPSHRGYMSVTGQTLRTL